MKLALDSMGEWRTNPIYSPSYHESGILIADNIGWGRKCVETYKLLNAYAHTETLSVEAAMKRFPIFADTDWDGGRPMLLEPGQWLG